MLQRQLDVYIYIYTHRWRQTAGYPKMMVWKTLRMHQKKSLNDRPHHQDPYHPVFTSHIFLALGIFIVRFVRSGMVHWVWFTLIWHDVRGGRFSYVLVRNVWDIVEVIVRWVFECFWDSSPAKGAGIGCHDWVRIVAAMVWKSELPLKIVIFWYLCKISGV